MQGKIINTIGALVALGLMLFVLSGISDPRLAAGDCQSFAAINQTASAQLITGTANQKIYICGLVIVSATAQNVSLVEGTGSVCATGIAALLGGTTASIALAANGGIAAVANGAWLKSATAADNICLLQSGTGNISGVITYTSRP